VKASEIVARARSVSDLPASKFVSHYDELNSLNESWKDIYSALIEADDDFYVTRVQLTLTPSNAVPNTQNEYLVPLPTDVLKIRYLDWFGVYGWLPMEKFPLSMKDEFVEWPRYRLQNGNLWIIGSNVPSAGLTINVGYYPVVQQITCPQLPIAYGTSYTAAGFALLTAPCYAALNQTMVYQNTGNVITAESKGLNTISTPVALFTDSGAVTNLVYYKGTLYWIRGGSIWYKATQLAAAFTAPTQVGALTGITSFFIVNNLIYYSNATEIHSCTLTGGSDSLLATATTTSVAVLNGVVYYVNGSGGIQTITPASTLYASGFTDVQADGNYVYALDTSNQLHEIAVTVTAGVSVVVATDTVIDTDVASVGQAAFDPLANAFLVGVFHQEKQTLVALDTSIDFNFSYPNNLVPEIMAWQSAMDYRSKREADITLQNKRLFGEPSSLYMGSVHDHGLWGRFHEVIKRDEYKPERIRNNYPQRGWSW
jgi:hypothetical protein